MGAFLKGLLTDRLAMSLPSTNLAKQQYFFGFSTCSDFKQSRTESYRSPSIALFRSWFRELISSTMLSELITSLRSEFSGESMWQISDSECFIESKMSLSMCPANRWANYSDLTWFSNFTPNKITTPRYLNHCFYFVLNKITNFTLAVLHEKTELGIQSLGCNTVGADYTVAAAPFVNFIPVFLIPFCSFRRVRIGRNHSILNRRIVYRTCVQSLGSHCRLNVGLCQVAFDRLLFHHLRYTFLFKNLLHSFLQRRIVKTKNTEKTSSNKKLLLIVCSMLCINFFVEKFKFYKTYSWGTFELFRLLSANPSGAGKVSNSSACESLRKSGIGLSETKFGIGLEQGDVSDPEVGVTLSAWLDGVNGNNKLSFLSEKKRKEKCIKK